MGEKGNISEALVGSGLASTVATVAAGTVAGDPSLVERVTTTTTHTVVGAGQDLVDKLRDKGIDATADSMIEEGRARMRRTPEDGEPAAGPPSPEGDDPAPTS